MSNDKVDVGDGKSSDNIQVVNRQNPPDLVYKHRVTDIRVYDRELTPDEIYNGKKLVKHWYDGLGSFVVYLLVLIVTVSFGLIAFVSSCILFYLQAIGANVDGNAPTNRVMWVDTNIGLYTLVVAVISAVTYYILTEKRSK